MADIDRAVEAATLQAFTEYTENRDFEPEPEPIYCGGCGDKPVDNVDDVCADCREGGPDNWFYFADYVHMRQLMAKQDARTSRQSEICAIRAMIPSMRRAI